MYSYLADVNDVFRDINVAELDRDRCQARTLLKRASLYFRDKRTLRCVHAVSKILGKRTFTKS